MFHMCVFWQKVLRDIFFFFSFSEMARYKMLIFIKFGWKHFDFLSDPRGEDPAHVTAFNVRNQTVAPAQPAEVVSHEPAAVSVYLLRRQ